MRGRDGRGEGLFSDLGPEARIPADRPLRALLSQAFHTIRSERQGKRPRITLGADQAHDVAAFVDALWERAVTPHIAAYNLVRLPKPLAEAPT